MDNCSREIDFLFETSWEVCNKIGGIYTVLSSKAKTLKENHGDKLIFIGPDVWTAENPSPYFIETRTAIHRILDKTTLPAGVSVRAGRWDIPGKPLAMLVKFDGMYANKDAAYGRMWELYKVDSLHAYGDYDEGCAFSRAAAAVIEAFITASKAEPRKVIAHFDEWTTAMGLLSIKADLPEVATVFTTHATSIGRSICGNGKALYDYLEAYNGDQMASELNMQSKHSLEKAAAMNADCFTTVSDVTAREAEVLLEKKADVVTPNGFELNFVPAKTRYASARKSARARLLGVANALTGIDYSEDTFIVATSGRCEYRNKGIDVYLDALNALGNMNSGRRILAYVLVPAWSNGARQDLRNNLDGANTGRLSDPVLTHGLNNYNEDPINCRIHQLGFSNDSTSQVSVIYVPCYLDGADGIFDMTYYQLLPGLDATVFASYYEPWGYTPLESIAFGVPTISTSLAGFGMWVMENFATGFGNCGTDVIPRTDSNYSDVVATIAKDITALAKSSDAETKETRAAAMTCAAKAQWIDFIKYYDRAYSMALKNRDARTVK